MNEQPTTLERRLGLADAVVIGLGSMIGAGIFAAFAPAAAAAGSGLLVGLAIAAIVAYCNASSSAQLAAQYPTSGGTYVYGRERLGEWPGFLAGWSFVTGKTASCAAMAMTFAAHVAPPAWQKPLAVAAVLALAAVNYVGVSRTARLTRIIVGVVLVVLAFVVVAGWASGGSHAQASSVASWHGWHGVLQSAGFLFFAFAGYARIATMGEEVVAPRRTIPRAILTALGITLVLYAVIAATVLHVLGVEQLASSIAPLLDVVDASRWSWGASLVRVGAAAASLGALLALLAGVGRATLALARNRDLPAWLSAVHPRYRVPHRAEAVLAVVISLLVLTQDLRGAIGFSSFGVLLYYFVANVAAATQADVDRRYPQWVQLLGALGCLVLVAALPTASIIGGLIMLAVGVSYRLVRLQLQRHATG